MRRSITRRAITTMGLAALGGLLCREGMAFAQDTYPNKVIKFVVPYPPGASTDAMARAFAQELARELKGTVIVENRPGAGAAIGAMAVKSQPADGYTLLFYTGELQTTKLFTPGLAYEYNDFEMVAPLSQTPYALVVPGQLNIQTLDDLKKRAASKKGELDFAVLGPEASHHTMLSRKLCEQLGVKAHLIPFKGGMDALLAVMGGEIDGFFATVGLTNSHKDDPRIRVLGMTSNAGSSNPFLPKVRSLNDLGLRDMNFRSLYGVAVRTDTPEPVKAVLRKAGASANASAQLKQVRAKISLEAFSGTLPEFIAEESRTFNQLKAAAAGIKNSR